MTPIEFHWAIIDYGELERIKIESHLRTTFESMRIQTAFIANMNPYVKKKVNSPQDLVKFEWDKVKEQSAEEMKAVMQGIAQVFGTKSKTKKKK